MYTYGDFDEQAIAQELVVLREWDYIQQSLLSITLTHSVPHSPASSRRTLIENRITQVTQGCAQIRWEDYNQKNTILRSKLIEIRYQQIHYGMLELAPGYLVSHLLPGIPQHLAHLCALLLALAEHEELLQRQLKELSPIYDIKTMRALTRRERDVLQGLVKGESESEIAQHLNITPTTIHTHLQRLYRRLEVHSAQQAILRSFALRLLNWLNLP